MLRRVSHIAIALVLLCAGALPMAWAARQTQGRVRKVKACVGIIPTLGEPTPAQTPPSGYSGGNGGAPDPDAVFRDRSPNFNPYVFYFLDQRKDLKPDGWEFVNPAAPAYPTLAHTLRWPGMVQAQPLKPDMAAYWEVNISQQNFDRLAQMDVIYLPIARSLNGQPNGVPIVTHFTETQRRILARLADAGVTIWVDWGLQRAAQEDVMGGKETASLAPLDRRKNPFFTNLDFRQNGPPAMTPVVVHPLLDSIYAIQAEATEVGSRFQPNQPPSIDRAVEYRAPDVQMTSNWVAVVRKQGLNPEMGAYIAAARYGAGFVVATAGNVGHAIAGSAGNPARLGTVDLGPAQPEDLKFAYNLIGWRSEVTAQQKNGRHTGQSGVQLNGLIEQTTYPSLLRPAGAGQPWTAYPPKNPPNAAAQLPINPVSPLIVNGVVIAYTQWSDANGQPQSEINAFDADGNRDFDGGNFTDDGLTGPGGVPINGATPSTNLFADFSIGLGHDRIMGLGGLPRLFGMTVGEVPDPGNAANDQGARAHVFLAGISQGAFTGLYSLPAPRPGIAPADYWNSPGVAKSAPGNVNIDYTGAPGFANLPGLRFGNSALAPPLSYVYAGGAQSSSALFGAGLQGKLVSFAVFPDGNFGRWLPSAMGAPTPDGSAPEWYYPPNQEPNRLGILSGPVVTAQLQDLGVGAIDTVVLTTSVASGDTGQAQAGPNSGDTTGKVEGFIVATRGDPLSFPVGNNAPGAGNPQAGRRFVCARWLNVPPGTGQVPQPREITWDPGKHYEVRVMDKDQNYVLARFVPGSAGFNLLPDGTGGQVELPQPVGPLALFAAQGQPNQWDLNRIVLVADYSPLPLDVDNGGKTIRPRFSPATPYVRDAQQVVIPTGVAGGVSVGTDNLVYYGTGQGYMCAAEWRRGRAGFRWKMRSAFQDSLGPNAPDAVGQSRVVDPNDLNTYLSDYVFTAAPAAGERIVFAARGRAGGQGTAYTVEPDATITFKLQTSTTGIGASPVVPPFVLDEATSRNIMLSADHGLGIQAQTGYAFILADQQPWGRVPNQFKVDAGTGSVTFLNMENFALDLTNVKSPEEMRASYGIDTGGKPAVPIAWAIRGGVAPGQPTPQQPWFAWIPIPVVSVYRTSTPAVERWLSGPVISGDRVYLMGTSGTLHEFPLDPKTVEPAFPRLRDAMGVIQPGLDGYNVGNSAVYGGGGIRKIRNVAFVPGVQKYNPAPAITDGMLAAASPRGLTLYHSPNIVVADSNRVVEASGDSIALANTDAVVKHRFTNNDFPIPTDPNYAQLPMGVQLVTDRKLLSRPAVVRKLDRKSSLTSMFLSTGPTFPENPGPPIKESSDLAEESYLAADTGNNRCVEFNPAGKVVWEADQFQDPLGILPAGESLRLSGPMDVQRWIELEIVGTGFVYVVHTLIADTGNTRVIELVDKIVPQQGLFNSRSYAFGLGGQNGADGQPIRWYHVLVWSSQTNSQGLKLKYRTAQRIFWQGSTGGLITTNAGQAGQPEAAPPYLPREQVLSYTMASVTGQQVYYPDVPAQRQDFFQYFGGVPSQALQDRKPLTRPGGDSIVFLRGRWKVEAPGQVVPSLLRENRLDRMGTNVNTNDPNTYRFGQGVVDPNVPIAADVYDEFGAPAPANAIHRLNGVSSIQRTVRADVKFAPQDYGSGPMPRRMYFLVADTDGVWEFQMLTGQEVGAVPANQPSRQFRLTMAFTNDDYAYVTGAGNGDPAQVYSPSPASHNPGGRLLSAVSARRMPNGQILIASRTPLNQQPNIDTTNPANQFRHHLHVGADVFLLRSEHFTTVADRSGAPYNRTAILTHGWQPDIWVSNAYGGNIPPALQGPPSIRWRAAESLDPTSRPTLRTQLQAGPNPSELTGSYIPVQPNYADMVY